MNLSEFVCVKVRLLCVRVRIEFVCVHLFVYEDSILCVRV